MRRHLGSQPLGIKAFKWNFHCNLCCYLQVGGVHGGCCLQAHLQNVGQPPYVVGGFICPIHKMIAFGKASILRELENVAITATNSIVVKQLILYKHFPIMCLAWTE